MCAPAFGQRDSPATAARVCNAGFPGENSAQLLARWADALQACPHPAAVVIFAGMNDAVNPPRMLPSADTQANLAALAAKARQAGAIALLVTVHQPDLGRLLKRHRLAEYGSRAPEQRIEDVNAAIREAAHESGAVLVDFRARLARVGGANVALSTDGVHLTAKGYGLLAEAVASRLPPEARRSTILCLGDSLTYGVGVREKGAPDAGSASYPQQLQQMLMARL
jgi:lysophospholipase L1-like esterase